MSKIMNILKEYIKRLFGRPTPQLMLTELRKSNLFLNNKFRKIKINLRKKFN